MESSGYLRLSRSHYAWLMKIYTRKGDDGTTGLLFGGRTLKDSDPIELNGAVDEAQAALGWARSVCASDDPMNLSIA